MINVETNVLLFDDQAIDVFMSGCTVFVFFSLMEYALVNILMGDIIDGEESALKKGMKSMFVTSGVPKSGSGRMPSASQQVRRLLYVAHIFRPGVSRLSSPPRFFIRRPFRNRGASRLRPGTCISKAARCCEIQRIRRRRRRRLNSLFSPMKGRSPFAANALSAFHVKLIIQRCRSNRCKRRPFFMHEAVDSTDSTVFLAGQLMEAAPTPRCLRAQPPLATFVPPPTPPPTPSAANNRPRERARCRQHLAVEIHHSERQCEPETPPTPPDRRPANSSITPAGQGTCGRIRHSNARLISPMKRAPRRAAILLGFLSANYNVLDEIITRVRRGGAGGRGSTSLRRTRAPPAVETARLVREFEEQGTAAR